MTQFALPLLVYQLTHSALSLGLATAIAVAPSLLFGLVKGNRLLRIAQDGTLSSRALPPEVEADGLVMGPDGALWFIDGTHNTIGRWRLSP